MCIRDRSQPLLCPFSLIRRQRPLGSVRRGKVARYKGKQAIPPLVVPPCAEAVPPQSGGITGACFTCCNGVWVIPRNEPARHRGITLRQQPRHRGDEPSERRFGTPVHHPVPWSCNDPCAPSGTRRSLGPAALLCRGRNDPVRAVLGADTAPPTEGSQVGGDVAHTVLCSLLAKPPSRHFCDPYRAVSRSADAGVPGSVSGRSQSVRSWWGISRAAAAPERFRWNQRLSPVVRRDAGDRLVAALDGWQRDT